MRLKLSVWQQFSSNHSAGFTLVGEFETPEAAARAAGEMQAFFDSINAWYARPENAALNAAREETDTSPPSDPEREISQQLGIRWHSHSVDWLKQGNQGAEVVDRFVFVESGQSWQGGGHWRACSITSVARR